MFKWVMIHDAHNQASYKLFKLTFNIFINLSLLGVYHLSDMHLYYNMASFLYKGVKLEPKYGSVRFGVLLVVLQVN